MNVSELVLQLKHVRRSGSGWTARCPAHSDRHNSLSVAQGRDGKVLLHCFAGCKFAEIVAALGLDAKQLFEESDRPGVLRDSARLAAHRHIEEFERWRNREVRKLNGEYRILSKTAQDAIETLRMSPDSETALDCVAAFAHKHADLCRSLDLLLCAKASEWLERDMTPVELFNSWRSRKRRSC